MPDKIRRIAFILPCAGEGRRLEYAGHKELFPVLPNRRLIDFSLDHIREAFGWIRKDPSRIAAGAATSRMTIGVTVVCRPWKTGVAEYVADRLPGIPVTPVMFDPALFEWPGSVHSARESYADVNIVLLPDSHLALSPGCMVRDVAGNPLVHHVLAGMEDYSVLFGYRPCTASDKLHRLGAIHVTAGGVVDTFQDKPATDLHRYNAFWCCYAFKKSQGDALYCFLKRSVARDTVPIERMPFHPAGAFPVHSYIDLGTPGAVAEFRADYDTGTKHSADTGAV